MKPTFSIQCVNEKSSFSCVNFLAADVLSALRSKRTAILEDISRVYSNILGEDISVQKTGCIVNAQAAFVSLLISSCGPLPLTFLSIGWFVAALLKCKAAK